MPTIRQIKEDIDDTMTFYDVAEVLSAISSLAFINISKLYANNFIKLSESIEEVYRFLFDNLNLEAASESGSVLGQSPEKAAILIGSNLGFCGKFNNDIKLNYQGEIGDLGKFKYVGLVGLQIFGVSESAEKINFPVAKKMIWDKIIEHKTTVVDQLIDNLEETGRSFMVQVYSNNYDVKTKKGKAVAREFFYPANNLDLSNIEMEDSGFYKSLNGNVLEPDPEAFVINTLKYYFRMSLLSAMIQSEVVENFYRMNAMNQAKDEIEIILKKARRKLQKMRQTKITNELLEVIQAH